jgi:hypothetical protein
MYKISGESFSDVGSKHISDLDIGMRDQTQIWMAHHKNFLQKLSFDRKTINFQDFS